MISTAKRPADIHFLNLSLEMSDRSEAEQCDGDCVTLVVKSPLDASWAAGEAEKLNRTPRPQDPDGTPGCRGESRIEVLGRSGGPPATPGAYS